MQKEKEEKQKEKEKEKEKENFEICTPRSRALDVYGVMRIPGRTQIRSAA